MGEKRYFMPRIKKTLHTFLVNQKNFWNKPVFEAKPVIIKNSEGINQAVNPNTLPETKIQGRKGTTSEPYTINKPKLKTPSYFTFMPKDFAGEAHRNGLKIQFIPLCVETVEGLEIEAGKQILILNTVKEGSK